jgi:hypothetical protein
MPTTPPTPAQAAATVRCPKCGCEARAVARFCQRCHMTLRYECPACHHEQRIGGACEKCGVDFVKYLSAMISAKRVERDAEHERFEQRSSLVKNILYIPLTLGIPLLRSWFAGTKSS